MVRHLVLLLALVAAFFTPPELVLEAGRAEIRGAEAAGHGHATKAEDGTGTVDLAPDTDGGAPPCVGLTSGAPVGSIGAAVDEAFTPAPVAPRTPWDRRCDIRRFRPSMYLGRSEPDWAS